MFNRRHFLKYGAGSALSLSAAGLLPAWAQSASHGNMGHHGSARNEFDLHVSEFPFTVDGRTGIATGVNGTVPAPLLRFREGEEVTMRVHNMLDVDTSIHWHGLLVPFHMDGVPGVSFPGIPAGEMFTYRFSVPQNGTYWYHSHSGLQEQAGHYGPIIIDPAHHDPVSYDREYVMVLSDWSFETPERIYEKLKMQSDVYNLQERTVPDFLEDANEHGLSETLSDRAMWGHMRMSPRDISDVTGSTYHFMVNGHATSDNWNGVFTPGERIRLRIINASAMTIFNVRMPGLPMTVVQADGLHVQPLETDEFQMGVAETYDVIIEPTEDRAYAFVAESIDRSGQVVASFGPRPGMRAAEPEMRAVPTLTMRDMGMDHGAMGHGDMAGMDMSGDDAEMDHSTMDHGSMDHDSMDHSAMGHGNMQMDHSMHSGMDMASEDWLVERPDLEIGPGVTNINAMPLYRLDDPGLGLENVPHRVLTYTQLRSLEPNPDTRPPEREIEIHLTSNMERYMWSFDGVRFSEVTEAIQFREGERVRVTLVNNTMMSHPIHLHGMFFDLVNGGGNHSPRKHTVIVKPAEKLSFDVSAEHVGDWAFHCHLLYHMLGGMMQVVSILPDAEGRHRMHQEMMNHSGHDMPMDHSQHEGHSMPMNHDQHQGHAMPAEPSHEGHSNMQHSQHGGSRR
ncbi:copper resistance system multicopper oxidase [Ponticaulis sp.]|uniref:copper resistance system multicopper oxidase n=1 Tax=Ponticaulis sp. TaxID=2020902 RepID=UPI000B740526|nr:copper resistance system multicopper oxidase [Ponticaulis sp.]MAI89276.1 copper-binding protein [Ponticaulis sp.]OUY01262.1 MAG: copper-binding protein [Hyphomonadaceae bacterium TMED5]|tara:strand:- start:7500 stop:9527 length:2028 start_codon:yes stop_codon:yes gene_type:complete